ncbi:unnamed protein product [Orchesella dallaii]|uniref:Uncharacterized protein n=1 Tax=Orchesella dallaii TaxID=48710 RepID=A0ABP1RLK1_9HEXA
MAFNIIFRSITVLFCFPKFLTVLTTSLRGTWQPQNTQRLENELDIFRDCSLHVAVNHINLGNKTDYDGSYNLEPFQFIPIILSTHRFDAILNAVELLLSLGDLYCDERAARLAPNQGFKFRAPPNPKRTCVAQVYIDPVPCKRWTFRDISYLGDSSKKIFGDTFLDPIFYYIKETVQFSISKSAFSFVHVTKRRELAPYFNEILSKSDYYLQFLNIFHAYNYIQPTKIHIQIAYHEEESDGIYNAIDRGLVTCPEYEEWWQRALKLCEKNLKDSGFFSVGNDDSPGNMMLPALSLPFIYPMMAPIMYTESNGYIGQLSQVRFVTCAPLKNPSWLSLFGLAAAFEGRLWVALGFCSFVSGIILHGLLKLTQLTTLKRIDVSLAYVGFAWGVLLGQGNSAVDKIRWIGGSWALVGVVLTNAYLGDNINMLTAPLHVKRVETFDELFQSKFSVYSSSPETIALRTAGAIFKQQGLVGDLAIALGKPQSLEFAPESTFTLLFVTKNPQLSMEEAFKKAKQMEKKVNISFEKAEDLAKVGDMEFYLGAIGECGMDAYVDTKGNLDRVYLQLKRRLNSKSNLLNQLTMSKDSYGEFCENWQFGNIPWPATMFLRKIHSLLESGLVPVWKKWSHWVDTLGEEIKMAKNEQKYYRPVALHGNIQVLFFFYLAITIVPIIVFLLEEWKRALYNARLVGLKKGKSKSSRRAYLLTGIYGKLISMDNSVLGDNDTESLKRARDQKPKHIKKADIKLQHRKKRKNAKIPKITETLRTELNLRMAKNAEDDLNPSFRLSCM